VTDPGSATWDSLVEGGGPPPRENVPVTLAEIVRYQGASGDLHPAHHDPDYAKAHGYPQLLSLGMLHASYLAAFATDWLGPENVRHIEIRFREVIWLHDSLTYSCKILRKFIENDQRKVSLKLLCAKQNGSISVEMSAIFIIP